MLKVKLYFGALLSTTLVDLGDVMAGVLTTGPKVRGFKPGQRRWIFKGDKSPQHPFYRRSQAVDLTS
jgi:hypothetical protein